MQKLNYSKTKKYGTKNNYYLIKNNFFIDFIYFISMFILLTCRKATEALVHRAVLFKLFFHYGTLINSEFV